MNISDVVAPVFNDVHKCLREDKYTHYWLKGGRASGKSTFIAIEIVIGLMRDTKANAIVYRQVAGTLNDSVVSQIQWAINKLGLSPYWRLKKSPYEFVRNDTAQRILFKGNDDEEKSKSIKLAKGYFKYIWFEELTEFNGMGAIQTVLRTLVRGDEHVNVFYSYNPPKNEANWVNADVKVDRPNRLIHTSTYLDLPKEWLGAQFLEDAEILKRNNELEYKWAYMGEVIGSGGLILTNWTAKNLSKNLDDYDEISLGQDFGFNHYNVVLLVGYRDGDIYVIREQADRNKDTDEIIGKCTMPKERTMWCDSAEPDRIKTWQKAGYRARAVQKERGSIHAQIDYLKKHKIYVDKSCVQTIKELNSWSWKHDDKLDIWLDEPVGVGDDAMAALRYAIEGQRKPYNVEVIDIMM